MPPRDHDLRELQRRFYRQITRGEITPTDTGLRVYADAYFWRLHDVLADQHEALRRTLGRDAFEELVRAYLDEYPPRHHDVSKAGQRLPLFLATCAETCDRPWLAELARLENLHLELFVAEDATPAVLADLAALAPDELPAARLGAVPAFALHECEYDVASLWSNATVAPARVPTRLVVWRKQLEVFHRVVDADEHAALSLLARGCPVAELGETLAARVGVEAAVRALGELVQRWIDDEILTLAR
jgi:hypothetical protein